MFATGSCAQVLTLLLWTLQFCWAGSGAALGRYASSLVIAAVPCTSRTMHVHVHAFKAYQLVYVELFMLCANTKFDGSFFQMATGSYC